MFTRQAPPIINALWQGGLSAASAAAMQNLLGQCRAPLRHNGPVVFDYTQQNMREILPSAGGEPYPGAQLPIPERFPPEEDRLAEDDAAPGGIRPQGFLPPEHLPNEPRQPIGPGERVRIVLQPGVPTREYFPGKYTYIDRQLREIGLECNDFRRHAVFPRNLNIANTINSVTFVGSGEPLEFAGMTITEAARTTEFKVLLKQLEEIDIVTGVDLSDPTKIVFNKKKAWVFKPEDISPDEILTIDCDPPPEEPA